LYSAYRFLRPVSGPRDPHRAAGTALIAVGALLPGIGGGMAKAGMVEALYVGELIGIILIWAGYTLCIRTPMPVPTPARESVVAAA
jgi:hypothetical protein